MAETNKFIGELDDGGTIQAADKIPVERGEENYYAVVGTAGTKAASDATKDKVASVNGTTTIGHLAVFSDEFGTIENGGTPSGGVVNATLITPPVLTTDLVPVIRGGQIYLATVDEILNAQAPSGGGGQFDFSDSQNSAYAAII